MQTLTQSRMLSSSPTQRRRLNSHGVLVTPVILLALVSLCQSNIELLQGVSAASVESTSFCPRGFFLAQDSTCKCKDKNSNTPPSVSLNFVITFLAFCDQLVRRVASSALAALTVRYAPLSTEHLLRMMKKKPCAPLAAQARVAVSIKIRSILSISLTTVIAVLKVILTRLSTEPALNSPTRSVVRMCSLS